MKTDTASKTQSDIGIGAYRELTTLVYRLRTRYSSLTLLATSTVHPRNPIPEEHVRLLELLEKPDSGKKHVPSWIRIFQRWILCVLVAVWDSCTILHIRLRYRRQIKQKRSHSAKVVLKTWCFGPESVSGSTDFYFGCFPATLGERGVASLLLCGNVLARDEVKFAGRVFAWDDFEAIPELAFVPLLAPLMCTMRQLKTCFELRRICASETESKFAIVCAQACLDCAHPTTMRNQMHFYIAAAVGKYWKPDVYVTLYEGQPWEKLAWLGMKSVRPECVIAGYQHTVVMRHALSLTEPHVDSREISIPDLVLCTGQATKRLMQSSHEGAGSKLIVFGSHRRAARTEPSTPCPGKRRVLVVPEGNPRESKLLFNFALRVASAVPDHEFVFRCHPLLPFEQIRSELEQDIDRFTNVTVSRKQSIMEDFKESSVLLYRGSSAVFYAVLEGLRPVYLRDRVLFDIDPLFELEGWREYVTTGDELSDILKAYSVLSSDSVNEEWRAAWDYVNSYTVPVSNESVDRFLSVVNLA